MSREGEPPGFDVCFGVPQAATTTLDREVATVAEAHAVLQPYVAATSSFAARVAEDLGEANVAAESTFVRDISLGAAPDYRALVLRFDRLRQQFASVRLPLATGSATVGANGAGAAAAGDASAAIPALPLVLADVATAQATLEALRQVAPRQGAAVQPPPPVPPAGSSSMHTTVPVAVAGTAAATATKPAGAIRSVLSPLPPAVAGAPQPKQPLPLPKTPLGFF